MTDTITVTTMSKTKVTTNAIIQEIEFEFKKIGVEHPIIHFEKCVKGVDQYYDEKTGKSIKVNLNKTPVECPICKHRTKKIEELRKIESDNDRENERMSLRRELHECPYCKQSNGIISSSSRDFEHTVHSHYCNKCNLVYPREDTEIYAGRFVNDDLKA